MDKSKVMVSANGNNRDCMNGIQRQEVNRFWKPPFLKGQLISDIRIRIPTATAAMARLTQQQDEVITMSKPLVIPILLSGCERWTLACRYGERRIQALSNECQKKLLRIYYLKRKNKDFV